MNKIVHRPLKSMIEEFEDVEYLFLDALPIMVFFAGSLIDQTALGGSKKIAVDGLKMVGNGWRKIAMKSRLDKRRKGKRDVILEGIIGSGRPCRRNAY